MRSTNFVTDADNAEKTGFFFGGEDMELNVHVFADLFGWIGEEIQDTCERVVNGHVLGVLADENRRSGRKAGVSISKISMNRPRSGGEWSSRKRWRKAGDERTARREERQVRAARTRVGREAEDYLEIGRAHV